MTTAAEIKKIEIVRITLNNFRGEKYSVSELSGSVRTIKGDNGLGKSRHFDAWLWLLFGKDQEGRDNYEIKTRIKGEELHNVETSVECVLLIDGVETTLKRALKEKWTKPRGQEEQVFKGNETFCWWNGTPISITEYNKRVAEIFDYTLFRAITNPSYFFSMKWQEQRELLFKVAGIPSDVEFAAGNPEFAKLHDSIQQKTIEDIRREILARKKKIKEELKEVPIRIDQVEKTKPEAYDFEQLEKEVGDLDNKLSELDNSLNAEIAKVQKHNEALVSRESKIGELKVQQQRILESARTEILKDAYKKKEELDREIFSVKNSLSSAQGRRNALQSNTDREKDEVSIINVQLEKLRSEWVAKNAEEYKGETICAACGQPLPEARISEAIEVWKKAKIEFKDSINKKGKELTQRKNELLYQLDNEQKELESLYEDIASSTDKLQQLETKLEEVAKELDKNIDPESIEEYVELDKEIKQLENVQSYDVNVLDEKYSTESLENKKKQLVSERDAIKQKLANKDVISRCEEQIHELEEKGRELSAKLAEAEQEEMELNAFTRAKIEYCEERVNSKFSLVSFKLLDYNIEDYRKECPIECCIPIVDGNYYQTANTAKQINAGLDVINTLSKFFGVSATIFIERRESVNRIIDVIAQVINLLVTEDEKIIIE